VTPDNDPTQLQPGAKERRPESMTGQDKGLHRVNTFPTLAIKAFLTITTGGLSSPFISRLFWFDNQSEAFLAR
jgi:hypothetical protein